MMSGVSSPWRGTSPEARPQTLSLAKLHLDDCIGFLENEDLVVALPDPPDERGVKRKGEPHLVEVDPPPCRPSASSSSWHGRRRRRKR